MKMHVRTIKLSLSVLAPTPEEKSAAWKRLYAIQNDAWRTANWIATGQPFNDQLVRRIYARKKVDPSDSDAVAQVESEFKDFFGTKRQATTERDIKEKFPSLPPRVTNPLNQVVVASYNQEKSDLLSGNRSLRTYRKTMGKSMGVRLHQGQAARVRATRSVLTESHLPAPSVKVAGRQMPPLASGRAQVPGLNFKDLPTNSADEPPSFSRSLFRRV